MNVMLVKILLVIAITACEIWFILDEVENGPKRNRYKRNEEYTQINKEIKRNAYGWEVLILKTIITVCLGAVATQIVVICF